MSDEEKAPYVQQAIDYKQKVMSTNPDIINDSKKPKKKQIQNNKRKIKNSNDTINRNNSDSSDIEETNKKKGNKKNLKEKSKANSKGKGKDSSNKRNKSEVKNIKIDDDDEEGGDYVNDFFCDVLAPFVEKSYEFLKKKRIIQRK